MKLKSVEFYQSVRLWDNQEKKTIDASDKLGVKLVDHLVILSWPDQEDIIVPTANMRHGRREMEPVFTEKDLDDLNMVPDISKVEALTPAGKLQVVAELVESGEVTQEEALEIVGVNSRKKCEKHCKFSRAINQPTPRLCTECGSPEEPKTK